MFKHAIMICMLLQSLEKQLAAAKADGVIDKAEMKALAISFLAGLVDVLKEVLPLDVIESALKSVDEIRDRVRDGRAATAEILDDISEATDQILS